ncbi:hypothetical protein [Paracoccus laeviglucosivorans]|uniref:Flagellar assembly protein FliH n=1 Tax=Paracoccus laeviglucosivorans TaxID=1197861 RepID=A0A521DR72_9RHOB|nr:hypothetical protein [Paracoccus laeviglucosivorans]SMO74204.1 hypothetical protein SAMN06265221_10976 [Paracoccus laeviglucosivorans]
MKSAVLRLESFASVTVAPMPAPTVEDVDAAYQAGYADGLAAGRQAALDDLTQQLAQIGGALRDNDIENSRIRNETLATVQPVLAAIVQTLGQSSIRERLLAALGQELEMLARHGDTAVLKIRCPPDLDQDVAQCIARAGFANIALEPCDMTGAEIVTQGGRIHFSPEKPAQDMIELLSEISMRE